MFYRLRQRVRFAGSKWSCITKFQIKNTHQVRIQNTASKYLPIIKTGGSGVSRGNVIATIASFCFSFNFKSSSSRFLTRTTDYNIVLFTLHVVHSNLQTLTFRSLAVFRKRVINPEILFYN